MNLLLKQSRELTNELKKYGAENGFGDGAGSFGALGALAQGASTPLRRTSGGSSDNFNQFGVPTDGDQIVNVQGQGASFNTQFGKFPLGKNRMTPEQRQQWLPVMEVLVKVMETSNPRPEVIKNVQGTPHIMTSFGAFPLSDLSLMTDEERATYLPATKTFVSVLKKDTLDADEMNLLLEQSRDLINLVPSNFLEQFGNGFAGLGR